MTLQRTAWTRRRALLALAAGGAADGVRAAAPSLPPSQSLQGELARALAARQPLVVMVSLHGCPWCKLVREHYLAPMHAQEGLPVVQIGMGGTHATRTVAGERTTHGALVRAWGVKLAPNSFERRSASGCSSRRWSCCATTAPTSTSGWRGRGGRWRDGFKPFWPSVRMDIAPLAI